jgi:hypothetical protein
MLTMQTPVPEQSPPQLSKCALEDDVAAKTTVASRKTPVQVDAAHDCEIGTGVTDTEPGPDTVHATVAVLVASNSTMIAGL